MKPEIISREKISLNSVQQKMIISGWGRETLDDTVVEKMTYLSDGLKVNGYLAYPGKKGKYPCIIWNRGGIGDDGAIDTFNAQGIYGQLASWGYCVFASQYRGNSGSEGKDEFGGSDVNDVLNLIPLAEGIDQADTAKWGIEGWSRGGMMTYLALTRTDLFKAAIIVAGISNLRCASDESSYIRDLIKTGLGNFSPEEYKQKCEARSAVKFAEKLSPGTELLLLHGTADERVLPHDSLDMAQKLIELKRHFRLVILENGDHFLKNHRKTVDTLRKEWFGKVLY